MRKKLREQRNGTIQAEFKFGYERHRLGDEVPSIPYKNVCPPGKRMGGGDEPNGYTSPINMKDIVKWTTRQALRHRDHLRRYCHIINWRLGVGYSHFPWNFCCWDIRMIRSKMNKVVRLWTTVSFIAKEQRLLAVLRRSVPQRFRVGLLCRVEVPPRPCLGSASTVLSDPQAGSSSDVEYAS
jgi:hypothetical protein